MGIRVVGRELEGGQGVDAGDLPCHVSRVGGDCAGLHRVRVGIQVYRHQKGRSAVGERGGEPQVRRRRLKTILFVLCTL